MSDPNSRDEETGLSGLIPDMVKKAMYGGLGLLFMGEEGVRNFLGDMKLPKDVVANLVGQIQESKRDLVESLAKETREFLHHIDVGGEIRKVLDDMVVDVNMSVKFRRAPDSQRLSVELESSEIKAGSAAKKAKKEG